MPNKHDVEIDSKKRWAKEADKHLLGRKIIGTRYMSNKEVEQLGWYSAALVIMLDNDTVIYPSQDDEGNNAGAIFGNTKDGKEITLPVI